MALGSATEHERCASCMPMCEWYVCVCHSVQVRNPNRNDARKGVYGANIPYISAAPCCSTHDSHLCAVCRPSSRLKCLLTLASFTRSDKLVCHTRNNDRPWRPQNRIFNYDGIAFGSENFTFFLSIRTVCCYEKCPTIHTLNDCERSNKLRAIRMVELM